jgi:hypothetical protein
MSRKTPAPEPSSDGTDKEAETARDLSEVESATIMHNAVDVRPTENVHHDPGLSEKGLRKAGELSSEESEAILRIATDVRPDGNWHPEED